MKRLVLTVALLLAALPATAHAFKLEPLAPRFDAPVYVTAAPGDPSRLFVVEQPGRIEVVRDGRKSTFLDITGPVDSGGEKGLLSMAFAPDYATSGLFYVFYTAPGTGGGSVLVVEQRRRATPDAADATWRQRVIGVDHPVNSNHNGGQLQFGPDGHLWISTGDGGAGNDPPNNAQNTSSRLGKILRIAPRPGAGGYDNPPGNPFLTGGGAPEVWAYGLRNPWRFSFDRGTGDLWIGDVGQNAVEEIDVARAPGRGAGANFGWRKFEGNRVNFAGDPFAGPHAAPIITHGHDAGWVSITGGYVIRDPALREAGQYVYGDFAKGELYLADPATGATRGTGIKPEQISGFGEDTAGRVYVTSLSGVVSRLVPDAPPPAPAGPTGPAGPSGPQADRFAPRLVVSAKRRQRGLRKRYVHLRVKCLERCRLSVTGSLVRRGRNAGLQRVRRTLRRGRVATVRVRIGARGRRLGRRSLRRGQRVSVRLVLRATDAAGNTRRRVVRIRVVR